jgi:hypothetical protein
VIIVMYITLSIIQFKFSNDSFMSGHQKNK